MKSSPRIILAAFICVVLLVVNPVQAARITVLGTWIEVIDSMDLISGAGSDLIDTHDSSQVVITIDITETLGASDQWEVKIQRNTMLGWPEDLKIYIKRTSGGFGSGSISGGT